MSHNIYRLARAFLLCILAGLFPLVALWKSNLGQIPTLAVFSPLLYTFLFSAGVFLFWLLVIRSPEKAALLSCTSLVFLLFYGHLYNLVEGKEFLGISLGYAKLFLGWFILFAVTVFLVFRARRLPDLWLFILPLGAVILMDAVSIGSFLIKVNQSISQPVVAAIEQDTTKNLPDIYYIVLDSYARDDIILKVIGYDNSAFPKALQKRGFYVPECAFSNYNATSLTLESVLNYDTLNNLESQQTDLILDNKVSKTFRAYGYQTVTGRGFGPFMDIQNSDVYLDYARDQGIQDNTAQQKFTSLYLDTTVFRLLAELGKNNPEMFSNSPFWQLINRSEDEMLEYSTSIYLQNNYMFDSLEKIAEKPGNYFVYAHIVAPHGPYTYNPDGSFRNPLEQQDEKVLYRDAIIFLNKRVLEMVDAILEKSSPAPIIIIQGDHGMHTLTTGLDKHKILSAYYLPGELSTPPYKTITPVNNFRLILRNYFDPSVQLLPDMIWEKFSNTYEAVPVRCDMKPW